MKLHSRWSMTDIIIIVAAAEAGGRAKGNKYAMQIAFHKLYKHFTLLKTIEFLRLPMMHFFALIPIKANFTGAEQSWSPGTFVLTAAWTKSPSGAPLADLWGFLLPLLGRLYYKGAARRDEAGQYIFICQRPSTVSLWGKRRTLEECSSDPSHSHAMHLSHV